MITDEQLQRQPYLGELYTWDTWYIKVGRIWHAFFLQAGRKMWRPQERHDHATVGHATSQDKIHWEYQGTAIPTGPSGARDDLAIWTGSIVKFGKLYYLFYTGRSVAKPTLQRIGLATSSDLVTWIKHPANPILEAGGGYSTDLELNEHGGFPAWRDPFVVESPDGRGWIMLITARSLPERPFNGCIALARSPGLGELEA